MKGHQNIRIKVNKRLRYRRLAQQQHKITKNEHEKNPRWIPSLAPVWVTASVFWFSELENTFNNIVGTVNNKHYMVRSLKKEKMNERSKFRWSIIEGNEKWKREGRLPGIRNGIWELGQKPRTGTNEATGNCNEKGWNSIKKKKNKTEKMKLRMSYLIKQVGLLLRNT